jgi:hypothetical protein
MGGAVDAQVDDLKAPGREVLELPQNLIVAAPSTNVRGLS